MEILPFVCSARWIGNHGFSIGIDDVQPGERLNQQKKMTIDDGYRRCSSFIDLYENRKLTLKPGANAAETLEVEITEVLNEIRKTAGDVRFTEGIAILSMFLQHFYICFLACGTVNF